MDNSLLANTYILPAIARMAEPKHRQFLPSSRAGLAKPGTNGRQ